MAKIKKRGKKIIITFDNKRESSNLLRAVGFKNIPALQDEQAVEHTLAGGQGLEFCPGHAAPVVNGYCFDCGLPRRPAAKA